MQLLILRYFDVSDKKKPPIMLIKIMKIPVIEIKK